MTVPDKKNHHFIIVVILSCSIFTTISAAMIVSPILKFLQKEMAFSANKYGIVISVYPTASFLFGLILGPVTDQYDKRKTLLCGLLGLAVTMFLTGAVTQLGLWVLFRGLTGIFGVITSISVYSYILDCFTGDDRAKVMGFVVASAFVAINMSPSAAIFISGGLSWHYAFYFFSALALACLFLSFFFLPVPDVKLGDKKFGIALYRERLFSFTSNRSIAVSMLVFFLMLFGLAVLREIYPTWLFETFAEKNVTFVHISYLFLFAGIGGIAGSVLSGYLAAKVRDKMFYIGVMILLLCIIALIMPFATGHIWQQFLIVFCLMTICSLQLPVFRTVLTGLVTPGERGSLNGLINSLNNLANASGAYVSTGLYCMDNTFRINGYFTAGILFCGSVMIWFFLTKKSFSLK